MTDRPAADPRRFTRRRLLAAGTAGVIAACSGVDEPAGRSSGADTTGTPTTTAAPETSTSSPPVEPTVEPVGAPPYDGPFPFTLGVASGDPDDRSVVLWTRIAPEPLDGGGLTADQELAWDVSDTADFSELAISEIATATAELGYSIHAIADGLEADTWYWYRFRLGEFEATGRTRTAPAAGATTPMRFAFSSCQHWESGAYAAHRALAETDGIDLFVWLGDYIYESGAGTGSVTTAAGVRIHDGPEVVDLDGYRNRYALYRSDPALQAHHAARPWVVTWDDHEVVNNYAGADDGAEHRARRAAAYQAWWEHMPVRIAPPAAGELRIHRTITWGSLLALHVLDGRQYRDPQPTDGEPVELPGNIEIQRLGPTALEAEHRMLGEAQETWLIDSVAASDARWQVLGNQVYMHGINAIPGPSPAINPDTWDGYHANREALLGALAAVGPENLVVISGDFHAATVAALRTDPYDDSAPVVGTEFMAPAISSAFPAAIESLAPLALLVNPHIFEFDPRNGYMVCSVDPEVWRTELHIVDDVTDEASPVDLAATFLLPHGRPGAVSVERSDSA